MNTDHRGRYSPVCSGHDMRMRGCWAVGQSTQWLCRIVSGEDRLICYHRQVKNTGASLCFHLSPCSANHGWWTQAPPCIFRTFVMGWHVTATSDSSFNWMWLDLFDCITCANEIFQESDRTLVSNEATSAQLNWGTGGVKASVRSPSLLICMPA